jgi:ankyrin repeat protein
MKHVFLSMALVLCANILIVKDATACDKHFIALKNTFTKPALMAKAKDPCATVESAEAYLETGTSVDFEDKDGNTPLLLAAMSDNAKFVEFFIGRGANVEHKNKEGKTALILATEHKALDAAKVLLEHKANIEAADNEENKPLYHAIITNNVAMVELLLEHGADYTATNNKKCHCSPLFTASMSGSLPMVKTLITFNALKSSHPENNADSAFIDNGRPLLAAVNWKHDDIADYLLKQGANVNKTSKGYTALHWWALGGTENMLNLLLAHGADINAQDYKGHTPLMVAAQQKQEQSAELLINHGANTELTCNNGHTWNGHTTNNEFRKVIENMIEEYHRAKKHQEL